MDRARSEDDIPTLPAFPVPGVREAAPCFPAAPRKPLVIDTASEGFFAVGLAMNDVAPTDDEVAAWWTAQRRRDLTRYVLAVVVVCLGILGATAAQLG